ncbi:MAG: 16S rRNA (guanine(527)-N(7))-methyltransferase RsmG [Coriobacteriia bacterium]|nr:16S rRNA (guanine(527)-N(7))-methyltransferase RsmG [Coriobacteriia bacterium]
MTKSNYSSQFGRTTYENEINEYKDAFEGFQGYSTESLCLLFKHIDLMLVENQKVNITNILDFDKAVYLHLYDSLLGVDALLSSSDGNFIDLGSGAGFPGIPLTLFSNRHSVLIDSSKKKAEALKRIVSGLGLANRMKIKAVRAEEESLKRPNEYTAVCVRAVGSLVSLMELASPLLQNNGLIIAYKGPNYHKEYEDALKMKEKLGYVVESISEYVIPKVLVPRTIIVFKKISTAYIKLPRKIGSAQNKPLK